MRLFIFCFCFFFLAAFAVAQSEDGSNEDSDGGSAASADVAGGTGEEALISEDIPERESEDAFWLAVSPEIAMYSKSGICFGAGLAFAYGKRVSIGFKSTYFFNFDNRVDVLEIGFLLRFYVLPKLPSSGLFIQIAGGHALFLRYDESGALPAQWGTMYGGVEAGWRFLLGNLFFIEPFVRGGYPYIAGGGVLAGVSF